MKKILNAVAGVKTEDKLKEAGKPFTLSSFSLSYIFTPATALRIFFIFTETIQLHVDPQAFQEWGSLSIFLCFFDISSLFTDNPLVEIIQICATVN